jgi:hypothetical protein
MESFYAGWLGVMSLCRAKRVYPTPESHSQVDSPLCSG